MLHNLVCCWSCFSILEGLREESSDFLAHDKRVCVPFCSFQTTSYSQCSWLGHRFLTWFPQILVSTTPVFFPEQSSSISWLRVPNYEFWTQTYLKTRNVWHFWYQSVMTLVRSENSTVFVPHLNRIKTKTNIFYNLISLFSSLYCLIDMYPESVPLCLNWWIIWHESICYMYLYK